MRMYACRNVCTICMNDSTGSEDYYQSSTPAISRGKSKSDEGAWGKTCFTPADPGHRSGLSKVGHTLRKTSHPLVVYK